MTFKEFLQTNRVYLDGGTGTLLQQAGLPLGELPERWNLLRPEVIQGIHKGYYDVGSNVVAANTFGANSFKFSENELREIIFAAIENAKIAAAQSVGKQEKFVALDIGPLGKLLKPYGALDFDAAVEIFAKTVRLGAECGADLILIETMNDCYETKAAVLAAKENSDLPVLVSNAYEGSGKLMTGASAEVMATMIESLGVDGLGVNCSLGPKLLEPIVQTLLANTSLPVLAKPNAGLPITENGITRYDVDAETFAKEMYGFATAGARILGGCCGTTPAHIQALVERTKDLPLQTLATKPNNAVSSYTRTLCLENAYQAGTLTEWTDIDALIDEGFECKADGAEILYLNVSGVEDESVLSQCVEALQEVLDLPICIESDNENALARAARRYNGVPLVKTTSGQNKERLASFVGKYGAKIIE